MGIVKRHPACITQSPTSAAVSDFSLHDVAELGIDLNDDEQSEINLKVMVATHSSSSNATKRSKTRTSACVDSVQVIYHHDKTMTTMPHFIDNTKKNTKSSSSSLDSSSATLPLSILMSMSTSSRSLSRKRSKPITGLSGAKDYQTLMSTSDLAQVVVSFSTIIGIPLLLYNYIPQSAGELVTTVASAWDGMLHFSMLTVIGATVMTSLFYHYYCDHGVRSRTLRSEVADCCRIALPFIMIFAFSSVLNSQLQLVTPGWIWQPFLWGSYKVYLPAGAQMASRGLCLRHPLDEGKSIQQQLHLEQRELRRTRETLCLPESSWDELSSGLLSSNNPADVDSVLKGIDYMHTQSGGMVVNLLCRDCYAALPALRTNIENLLQFIPTLSVVVFENDSVDGSREGLKQWAKHAQAIEKYDVDLMECPEEKDCKLGQSHRYDSFEAQNYFTSSAIGKMVDYRQRTIDYIKSKPKYGNYSHMLIMDVDLGVSISPLGVMHTIGEVPSNPVASSARQTWPGSMGTLVPPYDFSAFRAHPSPKYQRLRKVQEYFCKLSPPGYRWRNLCDAIGAAQMTQILDMDRGDQDIYQVESAFNGATLYPLNLLRQTTHGSARYDSGDDGQRCEHIGFHLSLNTPMFVNRKWSFNLKPSVPGGPTGFRALKNFVYVALTPQLGLTLFFQTCIGYVLLVFPIMRIVKLLIYPLLLKLFTDEITMMKRQKLYHKKSLSKPFLHEQHAHIA